MPDTALNITIPVFNRFHLTQKTLLSLRRSVQTIPFVITVVDNGSKPELVRRLRDFHASGIIDNLYLLPHNMGIAAAANIGWERVDAPFYMKLDNDIRILDPEWLVKLFQLWSYGQTLSTLSPAWEGRQDLLARDDALRTPDGTLGICPTNGAGAGIVVPKALADILGMWNEDYDLYGAEDGDYGLRMQCAGFPQYVYNAIGLTEHLGKDEPVRDAGLSPEYKTASHHRAYVDAKGGMGLYNVNAYCFHMCVRAWKVPRRFETADISKDNVVKLKVRPAYRVFRIALKECTELINARVRERGYEAIFDNSFIERLKDIMRNCGEGCG